MKKIGVFIILACFFVGISLIPTWYEWSLRNTLSGRSFELVHNYITDYHFYLSRIRQGAEGRWTVKEQYTSEPHRGSYVQIFYLFLGKSVSFGEDKAVGSQIAYHGARVVLGLLLFMSIVWVVRNTRFSFFFQLLALCTVMSAGTWPKLVSVDGVYRFGGYMAWWTLMDSVQRITFLPHLLFGQIGILWLMVAGTYAPCTKKSWQWIVWGILALILGIVFPPGLIFVGAYYGITMLGEILINPTKLIIPQKRTEWFLSSVLPKLCIGLISIPSLLYFKLLFGIYPWKRLVELDVIHPLPFQYGEYIQALGPTLPLGLIGMFFVFVYKEKKLYWINAWVVTWIVLLWIFQFIPQQSPLRFSEMAPQIPLGILTTYGFYQATIFIGWIFKKRPPKYQVLGITYQVWKGLLYIILYTSYFILLLVGFGVMYSSLLWQKDFIDQKVGAGYPIISMNNYIVYPVTGFMDAMRYLEKETPRDAVIVSLMTAGNYIPPFAGRTVYVGHDNTVDGDQKLKLAKRFFQGSMTKDEAQIWLREHRISYVFFGPQEKEEGKRSQLEDHYPFLQKVFGNNDVLLYQFQAL